MREIQSHEVAAVSGGAITVPGGSYVAQPPILWLPVFTPPKEPVPH